MLYKMNYKRKFQESQLRHVVVEGIMQRQRTVCSLQSRSVAERLRRHSQQHMLTLTDQAVYVFIFWLGFSSFALAQLGLAA